jgi:DNA-binding NtrC family response regulator
LAEHFLARYSEENGRSLTKVGEDALKILQNYGWPGNVRELENTMERAAVMAKAEDELLEPRHLPLRLRPAA